MWERLDPLLTAGEVEGGHEPRERGRLRGWDSLDNGCGPRAPEGIRPSWHGHFGPVRLVLDF